MDELIKRLERAVVTLKELKAEKEKDLFGVHEEFRLAGKLEGVQLALSYAREQKRLERI